jgi:hypothetical protein
MSLEEELQVKDRASLSTRQTTTVVLDNLVQVLAPPRVPRGEDLAWMADGNESEGKRILFCLRRSSG